MIDFSPIMNEVIKVSGWLVPIILCVMLFKSSWFKGIMGKALVKLSAKYSLSADNYRSLHNVTLPTPNGPVTIDHIFVSNYGIFVVEIKNMQGWIFGNETHAQWTQKIAKKFSKFQNPLHQNHNHVKALQSLLTVPESTIRPVIIFVGTSQFKTPMPANIIQGNGYIQYIKSFRRRVLSTNEVQIAFAEIESGRLKPAHEIQRKPIRSFKAHSTRAPRRSARAYR